MKMIDGAASHGLLEDVAHSRGADAVDHLDELRSARAEEGNAAWFGDSPYGGAG